ncbi:MAG: hypothetical protein J6Y77_04690 [Paludibacteraceae bacterium]|nr:hypothetical protein [Paludibacteraceae bacterium]
MVIRPSGFFDRMSEPKQVAALMREGLEFDGLPVLFGQAGSTRCGKTLVLEADFLASAYFVLTRYEELLDPERDVHGRFCSKLSWLSRCGWLQRPLVDAYGEYLHRLLTGSDPVYPQASLCLTHDLDRVLQFGTWRNWLGGLRRGQLAALCHRMASPEQDPYWQACLWLNALAEKKDGLKQLYFVYTATGSPYAEDRDCLPLERLPRRMLLQMSEWKATVGIHFSYASAVDKGRLSAELLAARSLTGHPVCVSRYHYLADLHPDDLLLQESLGIAHDYTAGYADGIGFRLGTCRPVHYISPMSGRLSNLVVHPLAVMDQTLVSPAYMGLTPDKAFPLVTALMDEVKHYGGELVLLWHNSTIAQAEAQKKLLQQVVSAW